MRKNTRIVSMAAAALLAVAPVAASAVPVNAAISLGTVTNILVLQVLLQQQQQSQQIDHTLHMAIK